MSRYVFVVFAILAIFSIGAMAGEPKCGENEIWTKCGTACPPSCHDPKPICTLQCVEGCQCIDGHVKDKCGKCIPLCDCPHKD